MAASKTRKAKRPRTPATPTSGPTAPQGPRIIGKVRRSHVASTFGAGAVVDMRAPTGAPLSGLVAGLEEWDDAAPKGHAGLLHVQRANEPRLQKRLSVGGFRLPPVKDDDDTFWSDVLPIVRFPRWLLCPRCEKLARDDDFLQEPNRPERWCGVCTDGGNKVFAVPVRFIVACKRGHITEFPWIRWIGCTCEKPRLKLETVGAGLAGKLVSCAGKDCRSTRRSLEGAFSTGALAPLRFRYCTGQRPWLPLAPESCQETPRVLQRGASNVYYPVIESALDIPPFSTDLSQIVGIYAADVTRNAPERWPDLIDMLDLTGKTGKPKDVLLRLFADWKQALDADSPDVPLEWAEYLQLLTSEKQPVDQGEFQTRPESVPPEFGTHLGGVVLARRLREVRAQVGFTRVNPPSTSFRSPTSRMGMLYGQALPWLPAVELRGEGIFIRFEGETLHLWETNLAVTERARLLAERRGARETDPMEETRKTSPRFLLLHSFAHALMRQLSLTCGYSSAALRERLYVGFEPRDMAGVLIHTGSADSEGTLGGLVRQGQEERLENAIREMLVSMDWCSSDPLCITGTIALSSPGNLAACHACLLAPETSCQHFNLRLDRAMLVGTPEAPHVGYFRDLLAELT